VEVEKVEAGLEDAILHLSLPKSAAANPFFLDFF